MLFRVPRQSTQSAFCSAMFPARVPIVPIRPIEYGEPVGSRSKLLKLPSTGIFRRSTSFSNPARLPESRIPCPVTSTGEEAESRVSTTRSIVSAGISGFDSGTFSSP